MTLDLDAARRQDFTTSFNPKEVADLLEGRLRMSPHPEWELPAEPTWKEDPFKDRNWCFQFHMLRWLEPLRRAAAKGDDAAYEMWLRWVRDWVEKNPPASPRSSWAWVDMSDGIRGQHLCLAAPLVAERSPELLEWLEAAIRTHAEHLADPSNMGNANHALHQQESLFVCGRVLGEGRLWQLALERMGALLREQYDEQGVNAEGAIAYHHNNYLWWERTLRRMDVEQIPRPDGADRHLHAPEEIAHATRPDGTYVTIGDTDHMTPTVLGTPLTDYTATLGQEGEAPVDAVRVYDAGYVFARSGWGDEQRPYTDHTFYSLRFGPSRRVHGHPDGTSVTYSASRTNWVVDPGKFDYSSSVPRKHVTSRAAHSVLSFDGRKPQKDAQVTLVRREITALHHDFVLEDDSFARIALSRRVVYSVAGEYLVVIDHATSPRVMNAQQRWQLGPDVTARHRVAGGVDLTAGEQHAALWFCEPEVEVRTVRGQEDPFDGWVATGWKKKAPAAAVTAHASGKELRFVTVLAAGRGEHPTVRLLSEPGDQVIALEVATGAVTEQIVIGAESVEFPEAACGV